MNQESIVLEATANGGPAGAFGNSYTGGTGGGPPSVIVGREVRREVMVKCAHCGTMNQQGERLCCQCSLDLDSRSTHALERSGVSWRAVIIIWAVVIAAGLLWWLMACIAVSGLSDW
jgi:hypothetical protein